MKWIWAITVATALAGCAKDPKPKLSTEPTTKPSTSTVSVSLSAHPLHPGNPLDPQPQLAALVHLEIYQFDLPVGSVSRDDSFWKRVDENVLGVGTSDLLFKNGLRCGLGRKSEWNFFHEFFARLPGQVRPTTVNGLRAEAMELPMSKDIDVEDLFVFNRENAAEGRTYQACTNVVSLSFEPSPRKPGSVRVAMCPVVRSRRQRLEFTAMNQEWDSPLVDSDRIYNLNVSVDVPDDGFLVISPGEDASRATSVGHRFFMRDGQSEEYEQVLVIVPTFLRLDGKPITMTSGLELKGKPGAAR